VAAASVVKASKNVWVIIAMLSLLTAVASAILDNTTTVLLFGPVSLQMAKMLHAKPLPFLIAMIFYCTLGGATTYVGDPPNVCYSFCIHDRVSRSFHKSVFHATNHPTFVLGLHFFPVPFDGLVHSTPVDHR